MPRIAQRDLEKALAELTPALIFEALLAAWHRTPHKTLAELFEHHEALGAQAKSLYELKDIVERKLVRVWKKNKRAPVDSEHYLDIEDAFRGQIKAFAPAFAHRYKLKLRKLVDD